MEIETVRMRKIYIHHLQEVVELEDDMYTLEELQWFLKNKGIRKATIFVKMKDEEEERPAKPEDFESGFERPKIEYVRIFVSEMLKDEDDEDE